METEPGISGGRAWESYLGPWLGGIKAPDSKHPGEGWHWLTDDQAFTFTNWAPSKPDNRGGKDTRMNFLGSVPDRRLPHWQDVEPSRPLPGFVVEYESGMPPETPSPVTGPVEFQRFTVRMQRPGNWWVEGVQFSEADSPGNKVQNLPQPTSPGRWR